MEIAVGDDFAAPEPHLLVQHPAQEMVRVQLTLHVNVRALRGDLRHRDEPALGLAPLIDDRVVLLRRAGLGDAGLDLLRVADQRRLDQPRLPGLLDRRDQTRVLRHRDGNTLFPLACAKLFGLLNHLGQRTNLLHNPISSLFFI